LWDELDQRLLPTLAAKDFGGFSESLYQYGILAGNCFSHIQGGPFSSPKAAAVVAEIRAMGFAGVGQSSWGPTLFALAESRKEAAELVARIAESHQSIRCEICQPNNSGWQCEVACT
jgi:predicted sugar kinase